MAKHKRLTFTARSLRRNQTEAEARLWSRLRNRQLGGHKFRRQMVVGNFIADFGCAAANLLIELDGSQHADSQADVARTEAIESYGFNVIRFWNNDVTDNLDGVLAAILDALAVNREGETPHPGPLPMGEGE